MFHVKPTPIRRIPSVHDHSQDNNTANYVLPSEDTGEEDDCGAAICEVSMVVILISTNTHQMAGAGTADFYVLTETLRCKVLTYGFNGGENMVYVRFSEL